MSSSNQGLPYTYAIQANERAIETAPPGKYEKMDKAVFQVSQLMGYVNRNLLPSLGYNSKWDVNGLHTDRPITPEVQAAIKIQAEVVFKIPVIIKSLNLEKRIHLNHSELRRQSQ